MQLEKRRVLVKRSLPRTKWFSTLSTSCVGQICRSLRHCQDELWRTANLPVPKCGEVTRDFSVVGMNVKYHDGKEKERQRGRKEGERQRQRQRETETDKLRQTDRNTDTQRDRDRERQSDRQTYMLIPRQTDWKADRQTYRKADRQEGG